MIENLIARFELENEKINKEIMELNLYNNVNEIINKVLNDVELNDEEIEILCDAINKNLDCFQKDRETIEFILFLLPTKDKLDDNQKDILKLLKDKYKIIDVSLLQRKKKRNLKFIEYLNNKEMFIYLGELSKTLKEYNYDLKDILNIIKLLIKNNYEVNLQTINDDSVIDESCTESRIDGNLPAKQKRI